MSDISDLDKIKIDILRDALKDVTDTIRALDRKIVFLTSYNALFLGIIGSMFVKNSDLILHQGLVTFGFALVIFFWICHVIIIMFNISPFSEPTDGLYTREKDFGKDLFFVHIGENKKSIGYLRNSFDKRMTDIDELKSLLYNEIVKLSFIRDGRVKGVRYASFGSYFFTFIFALSLSAYILSSMTKIVG